MMGVDCSDVLAVRQSACISTFVLPCFVSGNADDLRGVMGVNCSDVLAVQLFPTLLYRR
jgi:hypothetical protein